MNTEYTTYCGLDCATCEYREATGCQGCVASCGQPFHGSCSVAKCCIDRGHAHCGRCEDYVCDRLYLFAYDKEHGDDGRRIAALNSRLSEESDLPDRAVRRLRLSVKAADGMDKASHWMEDRARPLEASLWRFYFKGGSREDVLDELARYQNPDGGFGNGLEADFWLPESSAIATNEAFRIMHSIGVNREHPMVSNATAYLMNSRIPGANIWNQTPPSVNDYPHAIWWNHKPAGDETVNYNPAASLLGYMSVYASTDEERRFVEDALPKVVRRLIDEPEIGFEYLSCYRTLFDLTQPLMCELGFDSDAIKQRLIANSVKDTVTDPKLWNTYCPQPVGLFGPVDGPCSIYYLHLKDAAGQNIEHLINTADKDGLWTPPWNWCQYPDEFKVASEYWKGVIAIANYKALRRFGYV